MADNRDDQEQHENTQFDEDNSSFDDLISDHQDDVLTDDSKYDPYSELNTNQNFMSQVLEKVGLADNANVDQVVQEVREFVEDNLHAIIGGVVVFIIILFFVFSSGPSKTESEKPISLADLAEKENKVEMELSSFQDKFKDFSKQETKAISDISSKVKSLYGMVETNSKALIEQKKKLDQLTHTVKAIGKKSILQRTNKINRAKSLQKALTITAIVPGRAWVKTDNGDYYTVSVGDEIPGHGVVQKIEPDYGRVITSEGTIIKLGRNDG